MKILTSTDSLQDVCCEIRQRSGSLNHPSMAVDTEFLREKTYWPQLCLIQIGFQESVWIIDPLCQDMNLTPFYDLLQDQEITKIFHAARQDLEIFYHHTGQVPTPFFDTQIGAMVCGYQDSVGYETLVADFLSVKLDKSSRRTDWSQRPLSDAQLAYAAADVRYLVQIYASMHQRLKELNRGSWVQEEMARFTDPTLYNIPPEQAYQRLKVKKKSASYLEALRRLAAWRETYARQHNLARSFVLKDEVLQDLALLDPKTEDEIYRLRSLKGKTLPREKVKTLLNLLTQARNTPLSECPPSPSASFQSPANRQAISFLKLLLSEVSQKQGVAEKLIATTKDLERYVLEPDAKDHPLNQGWRFSLFGQDAQKLLKGALKVRFDHEKLVFEEA